MCEWQSELIPDYRCQVPPEPGSQYCIFHDPGEKDAELFIHRFHRQINEEGPSQERNGQYDFTGYVFPTKLVSLTPDRDVLVDLAFDMNIQPPPKTGETVDVEQAAQLLHDVLRFPKVVDQDINFSYATFKKSVHLIGTELKGRLMCERASFRNGLFIRKAVVGGGINLDDAKVEIGLDLGGTAIGGDSSFKRTSIDGNVHFKNVRVDGHLTFEWSRIAGDATFQSSSLRHIDLFRTEITSDLIFANASMGELRLLCCTVQGYLLLTGAKIENKGSFLASTVGKDMDLRIEETKGLIEFKRFLVNGIIELSGEKTFQGPLSFEDSRANGLYLGEGKPRISGWSQSRCGIALHDVHTASSFWLLARLTYEKLGMKDQADASHYFERLWRWKALRCIPIEGSWTMRTWKVLQRINYASLWFFDCVLIRWPTAYGASLSRLFATWTLLVSGFATVYYLFLLRGMELFSTSSPGLHYPFSFGRALYFSIITFTTLGYGDIQPVPGLGSALCATEAILGGIMMALTVLVIGRKFMR